MGQRFASLDGLRGLLAMYVLVSHMAPFAGLPAWAVRPLSHGEAAVDVFFILSGMVIVRSLQNFGCDRRRFLLARAARTLPAFFTVFVLAVPIQLLPTALAAMPWIAADNPGRVIWSAGLPTDWFAEICAHLVMAHGLFPNGVNPDVWVSFLGAAWSLSTEWQFYALVALLAPVLRGDGPRRLAIALLLLAAAAAVWRFEAPAAWQFSRAFLPNKAVYFALGIASAGALDHGKRRRLAIAFGATLAICLLGDQPGKLAAPFVWMCCLAAETQAGMPPFAWLGRLLRSMPILALGQTSYSIYLINEPVQKVLALLLAGLAGGDRMRFAALWVPGAIAVPLVLAIVLHRYVEAPGLRFGRSRLRLRAVSAG